MQSDFNNCPKTTKKLSPSVSPADLLLLRQFRIGDLHDLSMVLILERTRLCRPA